MMRRQLKYLCTAQNEKKKSQTNVNTEVCQSYTDLSYFKPSRVSSKKKKFVRALFSRKPSQTIYKQKDYKNVEFDKITFCFGFCFQKTAKAVNSKMTD